jgi:hypothetical protein
MRTSLAPVWLHSCDTVDFDVEMAWPGRNVNKDPGRRIFREKASVNSVHGRELADRRAIDIAFHNILKRGSRRFQTEFHLLNDDLGLSFLGASITSPVAGSKGGNPDT